MIQRATSNLVVLRGAITNEPVTRELPGGDVVAQFDVTTAVGPDERPTNVSVPVAWHNQTPSVLARLVLGDDVVVVGSVRRRFFRSGGATQSRTEVVADRVVPARRAKTARSVIAAAAGSLEGIGA